MSYQVLREVGFRGWGFIVGTEPGGLRNYLQVEFSAPSSEGGSSQVWRGRKWFLSPHMTDGEIVQTAFKAVLTALEHEAREDFTYKGEAVFGPHFDLDALVDLCRLKKILHRAEAVEAVI